MDTQLIGGNSTAPAAADVIKDSDTAHFMADVVEASRQVPVIVDFWATWCGPCRQLGPALEKAVLAAKGKVRLVKIDVDKNQQLAAQMRIQSIPAVYAFVNGQPVDGFLGALPESQIKAFIDRLTAGVGGGADQEVQALLAEADEALRLNNPGGAIEAYAQVLQYEPDNLAAIAGLARCQIQMGDPQAAAETLQMVPADKQSDPLIASARAALELAANPVDTSEIDQLETAVSRDPKDLQSRFDLAMALNAVGRRSDALEHLLAIVRMDRAWNEEAARKQIVKLFEAWGPKDELTVSGRRKLSSILFS
ncbi:thioredoxin [Rhodoligotrophos defluvii]|uniref:thioredoxin n=1 Tax=Rhodoligotrophos defluvii TaxID=2561934 RepID=UPI0010C9516D|nr:thioredoxin [Rhodoligotrophos defluvii]